MGTRMHIGKVGIGVWLFVVVVAVVSYVFPQILIDNMPAMVADVVGSLFR